MSTAFHWPNFIDFFSSAAAANGFTVETLLVTENGPLNVWERPAAGPRIYLSAGIHGDEPAGPLALLELMRQGFFAADVHWLISPALNPDGLARAQRENAAGIDLNRDYLHARSEEVQAHLAWLAARPAPALLISLHEDWETTGFYLYEINLKPDQPQRARQIIGAAAPWFEAEAGPEIDGHTSRESGWIYHAAEPDLAEEWPEAIHLAHLGCPVSFTFETPSTAALTARVAAQMAAIRAACSWV
jgi:murein peptide amidase A